MDIFILLLHCPAIEVLEINLPGDASELIHCLLHVAIEIRTEISGSGSILSGRNNCDGGGCNLEAHSDKTLTKFNCL